MTQHRPKIYATRAFTPQPVTTFGYPDGVPRVTYRRPWVYHVSCECGGRSWPFASHTWREAMRIAGVHLEAARDAERSAGGIRGAAWRRAGAPRLPTHPVPDARKVEEYEIDAACRRFRAQLDSTQGMPGRWYH